MTPNSCKNVFLEDDGFCTFCGKNHLTEQPTRGQIEKGLQKKAAAVPVLNASTIDPLYRTAKETALKIAEDFGVKITVIFQNRVVSCADRRNDRYTIIFGYQNIDGFSRNGFLEYASLRHLYNFQDRNIKGTAAAKAVAIHEVAHIIAYEFEQNWGHTGAFVSVYSQLLKEYFFK